MIPKVGDKITTNIGNTFIVEEIIDNNWVFPQGGHEYTYLIPFENIVAIEGPKEGPNGTSNT